MTVNAAANVGGKVDKVLWVTVRFFLLSTEMSVVIFGLAFGKDYRYFFFNNYLIKKKNSTEVNIFVC